MMPERQIESTMTKPYRKTEAVRFTKFLVVGVMNTLVTLAVIFLLHTAGSGDMISNFIGYVAGLINSFLWNRQWVFRSTGHSGQEAVRFIVGFAICYGIQAIFIWGTTRYLPVASFEWNLLGISVSGYGIATLIGMGIYTVANYVYNRTITFRAPH